jgi:hypothetical protein
LAKPLPASSGTRTGPWKIQAQYRSLRAKRWRIRVPPAALERKSMSSTGKTPGGNAGPLRSSFSERTKIQDSPSACSVVTQTLWSVGVPSATKRKGDGFLTGAAATTFSGPCTCAIPARSGRSDMRTVPYCLYTTGPVMVPCKQNSCCRPPWTACLLKTGWTSVMRYRVRPSGSANSIWQSGQEIRSILRGVPPPLRSRKRVFLSRMNQRRSCASGPNTTWA